MTYRKKITGTRMRLVRPLNFAKFCSDSRSPNQIMGTIKESYSTGGRQHKNSFHSVFYLKQVILAPNEDIRELKVLKELIQYLVGDWRWSPVCWLIFLHKIGVSNLITLVKHIKYFANQKKRSTDF